MFLFKKKLFYVILNLLFFYQNKYSRTINNFTKIYFNFSHQTYPTITKKKTNLTNICQKENKLIQNCLLTEETYD